MKLLERWITLLHRTATGTRSSRTLLTPIGVAIFGAFTALFVVAAILVDEALGVTQLHVLAFWGWELTWLMRTLGRDSQSVSRVLAN